MCIAEERIEKKNIANSWKWKKNNNIYSKLSTLHKKSLRITYLGIVIWAQKKNVAKKKFLFFSTMPVYGSFIRFYF